MWSKQQTATMKAFYLIEIYNLGFFGGWRCGNTGIDGQYVFLVAMDKSEFTAFKFGGYNNLTSFPDTDYVNEVFTQDAIDFMHDALISYRQKNEPVECTDAKYIAIWNQQQHFPIYETPISRNIHAGDAVTNLITGEKKIVEYGCDLKYYNRNMEWKLDRRNDHVEPMTITQIKALIAAKNPFEGWVNDKPLPKKPDLFNTYLIEGNECNVYCGDNEYWITYKGEIWYKHSHSRVTDKVLNILFGLIYSEYEDGTPKQYCLFEVKETFHFLMKYSKDYQPDNHRLFLAETSYHYNTRETYL